MTSKQIKSIVNQVLDQVSIINAKVEDNASAIRRIKRRLDKVDGRGKITR